MVSLEVVALVLTGLGLTASIVYYANVLKNATKAQKQQIETRQAAIFSSLQSRLDTPTFWNYYIDIVWQYRGLSYEEFKEQVWENQEKAAEMMSVISTFNHIGWLVHRNLLDITAVIGLTFDPVTVYEVVMPNIIRMGEERGRPQEGGYPYYTYLVEETKEKRKNLS